MKKILIATHSLELGGIEKALITLLDYLKEKYDVTLVLEKNEGFFKNSIPNSVNIIEYKASSKKNVLLRKIDNFFRQIKFKKKYKNKFDAAICFATYSYPCSFVARNASKKSILWVHNDYLNFFNNDKEKYINFFKKLKINRYEKIVFVSKHDKNEFINIFEGIYKKRDEIKSKTLVFNNLIDFNYILDQSKQRVNDFDFEKYKDVPIFINIGRHDEKQKKLSRIINSSIKLSNENYKFIVLFVGDGENTKYYKELSKDENNIFFLGAKQNPYPYLKNSSCLLMSSDFEGYPVTILEALALNKFIITTDVSDVNEDIKGKYGLVTKKTEQGVYEGMKYFIENYKNIKIEKFDTTNFNDNIKEKIDKIITT